MNSAVLLSDSNGNLELLLALAKKLGIKAKTLNEEELEDLGLLQAMKQGATGEYVDTAAFMNKLRGK